MKTIFKHIALFALFLSGDAFAQDVTTVRANNSDISDNLDLKAVASIFAESRDLEDFERRLNDPEIQISNLDLNGDSRVDYIRVIEATENGTHLIILQAVLGPDVFQDVATIEVERDRNNNVQVQFVGDVYMYGPNYIYEPVYYYRPAIYDVFWVSSYRPYYSPWYWDYYPTYYTYWAPYPVYRYRNNVHVHINSRHTYVYANNRRSSRAATMYSGRRQNDYERQNPNTSFSSRNKNVSNRYALDQSRADSRKASRGAGSATRSSFTNSSRNNESRKATNVNTVRNNGNAVTTDRSARKVENSRVERNETQSRGFNNSSNRNTTPSRVENTQPARVERSAPVNNNRSFENNNAAPARSMEQSAPVRVERSAPVQQAPARQSAPAMQSAPARQSSPAPAMRSAPVQRQSAPAQSAPARSGGGGGGRRG